jgi:glycosyltransferase involved in cell wall biosynthesis
MTCVPQRVGLQLPMILHLITNLEARAGAEGMLCRLVKDWKDEPALVVPLMQVSERNRALAGGKVSFAPLGAKSALDFVSAVPRIVKIIRSERPIAIMCWMYHAMALGAIAAKMSGTRIPLVWNVRQSLDDVASLSYSTRAAVKLCRAVSNAPDGTIYNSERARVLHAKFGYSNRDAKVIPNGFDLPEFKVPDVRSPHVFGIAGRFHPQKDHDTFFKAAAAVLEKFPHARFLAVGAGMTWENSRVRAMIEQARIPEATIRLEGEVDDMQSFYRSIDVLVLSSRTEGFPNVVAEAMSNGKPVVTTDVGDAARIVGGTGIVVPPGESEALAKGMCEMMALSGEQYRSRAGEARERIEDEFELSKITRQYAEYLAHLLGKRTRVAN